MDVLRADRDDVLASASASRTAARHTNGGQITRMTPGTRVRAAIVRASSPASAGVVCIFQLAATMTIGRMPRIMAERQSRRRRCGVPRRLSRVGAGTTSKSGRRTMAQPIPRRRGARAARAAPARAGPPTDGSSRRVGDLGQRWPRASRAAPPATRGRPAAARASRPSASSVVDRSELAAGGGDDRWRFADSALRTRFSSPRSARATCRASSSSSAALAPIRPRNVRDRLRALPGHDAAAPAHPPRRRAARRRASRAASSGASSGGTTNSRCARPPARLSEPRARNRPRSHAMRQCSGGARPTRMAGRPRARRRVAPGARPRAGSHEPRDDGPRRPVGTGPRPAISARRSHGRDGSTAASSARSAATRSRSVPVTSGCRSRSGRPGWHAAPAAVAALALPARG